MPSDLCSENVPANDTSNFLDFCKRRNYFRGIYLSGFSALQKILTTAIQEGLILYLLVTVGSSCYSWLILYFYMNRKKTVL